MKISQRVKIALSVLTTKNLLGNSLGAVVRNFTEESTFNPRAQLRGITYKAIDKIGMSTSLYEPLVKKANGDAYTNHPVLAVAKNPNPKSNSSDFNHLWAMYYEIYGETFWYLARGESSNKVKEVYLLPPAQIELKVSSGELVGYVLHKNNGQQIPFDPEEIIHDKRANPFNQWRGMSVLERASVYVDTEIITSEFTLNYMKNNASPSGIVTVPNMERSAFKQFTEQWREKYEGPGNAGKTAFIRTEGEKNSQATFQAVGATLKDVDQKITREMAKEDVLMMMEVPKELLGISAPASLGRAGIDSVYYIYNSETINPLMKRLDRIWEKIAKLGGLGAELKGVTHVSPIPEDKVFNLARNEKAVNRWMTVDEVREQEGLDPIPGGNVIVPQNSTPVTDQTKSIKKVVMKPVEKKLGKAEKAEKLNNEQEQFRAELVEKADIYVKQFKSALSKFMGQQEAKVIGNINASSKIYDEWLTNVEEESVALALILTPIIISLMEAQAADVSNFITGEALVMTPEIRKKVDINILKLAGTYNTDTVKALEKTLSQGQAAGESLVKLKKRVEATYQEAKGYRAERIARTESMRASNSTAELVYKNNGFSTVKWFANPGACPICAALDGEIKSIGSNYREIGDVVTGTDGSQMSIGYDNIETPPIHPNCSCSLVPED